MRPLQGPCPGPWLETGSQPGAESTVTTPGLREAVASGRALPIGSTLAAA